MTIAFFLFGHKNGFEDKFNCFKIIVIMIGKKVQFASSPIIYSSDNTISAFSGQLPFDLKQNENVPLESCLKLPKEPKINLRTEYHDQGNFTFLGILILLFCLFGLFMLIYYSIHLLLQIEIEKVSQSVSVSSNTTSL